MPMQPLTPYEARADRPTWKEGHPKDAGVGGWVWVCDEEGEKDIMEISQDGEYKKPRGLGKIVAWAGPIVEPDDETLP